MTKGAARTIRRHLKSKDVLMAENSLVSIANRMKGLDDELVERGGELSPEEEAELDLTTGDLRAKVDAYYMIIKEFEARAKTLVKLAEPFVTSRKAYENKAESLLARMKFAMQAMGVRRVEGDTFEFALTNSQPALVINEAELPKEYFTTVTTVVPDKERIKGNLLLGIQIPGASLRPVDALRPKINHAALAKPVKEIK